MSMTDPVADLLTRDPQRLQGAQAGGRCSGVQAQTGDRQDPEGQSVCPGFHRTAGQQTGDSPRVPALQPWRCAGDQGLAAHVQPRTARYFDAEKSACRRGGRRGSRSSPRPAAS